MVSLEPKGIVALSFSSLIAFVSQFPWLHHAARWTLELGFVAEKKLVRDEGVLAANRVLDLGCGTGMLTREFEPEQYFGIDVNARHLRWAKDRNPRHNFARMDGTSLALCDASVDAVVIGGILHHLSDAEVRKVLREVKRVLLPNKGRLILWEDIESPGPFNVLGHLVHRGDQGEFLRTEKGYSELVLESFPDFRSFRVRSGVCDYCVIVTK